MYRYEITRPAFRELSKLPVSVRKKIIQKLDYFIKSEKPLNFAQNLINYEIGSYRFRIGDYRVIFDIEDETLVILSVGHRREIYK